MTIKELCNSRDSCTGCPFSNACFNIAPESLPPDEDQELTDAIIETARRLEELE